MEALAGRGGVKAAVAVARFLRSQGIRHVFAISGGASLHLIHGIDETEGIEYVCPQTEQAAGFAADAYARLRGLGCAIATSGPGATNLLTCIAASYYDSVPVLYITGNQTRERLETHGTRQIGFQATPIVEMVKPVSKWAFQVRNERDLIAALDAAICTAKTGRPGPVLIDIPDDVQRANI